MQVKKRIVPIPPEPQVLQKHLILSAKRGLLALRVYLRVDTVSNEGLRSSPEQCLSSIKLDIKLLDQSIYLFIFSSFDWI